jgi:hypothetical protein
VLGWVTLAGGEYAEASRLLSRILTNAKGPAAPPRQLKAWILSALGRAELGLGNREEAQEHLYEALEIVIEIRAFIRLMHLIPLIAVGLADAGDARLTERAVELYAMGQTQPFLAKAQLFEDIAGRFVRDAADGLPSERVEAAQARGRALDWWETAEALLDELKGLGWADKAGDSF